MAAEVKAFRETVKAWLQAISTLQARISSRVYYGWPMEPPAFPMITFGMAREWGRGMLLPDWSADLIIDLHAVTGEELDDMEDDITNWLSGESNNILTTLSDATVYCYHFGGGPIAPDVPTASPESNSYTHLTRALTFSVRFNQKGA